MVVAPQLQPEMKDVVESLRSIWAAIWEEQVQPFIDEFNKVKDPFDRVKRVVGGMPLSDLGSNRVINGSKNSRIFFWFSYCHILLPIF